MRKIFIQFLQWILKHRKKLVYWALAFFVFGFCFLNVSEIWVGNVVFADDAQTQQQKVEEKFTEWQNTMSFFNKACNVFIYPLLVIAWNLVDNSFVYWEVFKFDAVLWQLWNIVKNLANFALWFLFLYQIFKYLIGSKENVNVKTLLLKVLIAWVWIQASWFIMAALIDVSTILTYWVGWLPISVLKESSKGGDDLENNPYIMKSVISLDVNDMDTMNMYLTNTPVWDKESWQFYISQCETFKYSGKSAGTGSWGRSLILAPKNIYYEVYQWKYEPTDSNRCHYYGNIYYFDHLYNEGANNLQNFVENNKFSLNKWSGIQDTYQIYQQSLENVITKLVAMSWEDMVELIKEWVVLEIWDAHKTWWVWWALWTGVYQSDQNWWLDKYNKWTAGEWDAVTTSRLQNILDGNSYVGVFTSLYASLVNSKQWRIDEEGWLFEHILNIALELWFTLAISVPLIVISIVFMMRIGILWLAIVLSPFIVLFSAFDKIWDKVFKAKTLENLKLENLIPIIFSPAIICFAISMCTVLISFISWLNSSLGNLGESMDGEEILGWLVVLNVGSFTGPMGKIIISILGVAITWFLAWAAIETSNLWKSGIVEGIKKLTKSWLWTLPIIPIPTKDGVKMAGTAAVFGDDSNKGLLSRYLDNLRNVYDTGTREAYGQLFGKNNEEEAKKKRLEAYKTWLTSKGIDRSKWMDEEIEIWKDNKEKISFNSFKDDTAAQEEIINAINGMNSDKRKTLTLPNVQIWNKEYEFVTQRYKKDSNGNPVLDPNGNPEMEDVYQYLEKK